MGVLKPSHNSSWRLQVQLLLQDSIMAKDLRRKEGNTCDQGLAPRAHPPPRPPEQAGRGSYSGRALRHLQSQEASGLSCWGLLPGTEEPLKSHSLARGTKRTFLGLEAGMGASYGGMKDPWRNKPRTGRRECSLSQQPAAAPQKDPDLQAAMGRPAGSAHPWPLQHDLPARSTLQLGHRHALCPEIWEGHLSENNHSHRTEMLACVRFGRLLTFYGGHLCMILSTVTYTYRCGGGLESDFLR